MASSEENLEWTGVALVGNWNQEYLIEALCTRHEWPTDLYPLCGQVGNVFYPDTIRSGWVWSPRPPAQARERYGLATPPSAVACGCGEADQLRGGSDMAPPTPRRGGEGREGVPEFLMFE